MLVVINATTVTEALKNGDPAVEKFVCTHVVDFVYDTVKREFSVVCVVSQPGSAPSIERVYLHVGSQGTMFGDI